MSRIAFNRGDEEQEEEEDEVLLDSPNFSRELVAKVRGCGSELEVLQYLVEEKPPELKLGREHYLEKRELEEYMQGLCLKLDIHGYEDRARRLKYLYEVLRDKFVNKEHVFKIVVQFLMDMAQRPTAVTHLLLSSVEYSREPDEDDSNVDEDSERQKSLLKEIMGDDENDREEKSYSSGDSLSEWSDEEEEEDISAKSNNSIPPGITRPVRTSSSFGEFSDIYPEGKPDPEKLRKEAEQYWREEKGKAEKFLSSSIRRFEAFPLQNQPVISSRLVLQARFGEHWEWKQKKQEDPQLQVCFVEDVVREVLWQLVISRPDSSPIFNADWSLKPNLMVASLSKSSFTAMLSKFGASLAKLETLRKFERDAMSACHLHLSSAGDNNNNKLAPSKVYRNYAAALQDISIFIMEHVDQIERELKRLPRPEEDPAGPACSTFVQLQQQTRSILEIIELVYKVHSKCIPSSVAEGEEVEEMEPWLASVKLISCIEAHLVLETRPNLHGVLLFLYSKCLHALLDEMLFALKSLKWDERYSLFVRDKTILLNSPNFWSECIKIREFSSKCLSGGNLSPLTSLRKLLPKVLNILKTCEVFDQLQEDFSEFFGDATKISVKCLVQEFLEESLSSSGKVSPEALLPPTENLEGEESTDFFKHFNALGLGSSLAANCFRFLMDPAFIQATTPKARSSCKGREGLQQRREYTFQDFLQMTAIPVKSHAHTLDKVLSKWFDPFCLSAKQRIEKIFQDYKVLERMTVFQEIILAVREDFARGIILIAARDPSSGTGNNSAGKSPEYTFEDTLARNSKFQRLLNDCYPPECRGDIFSIDLKMDRGSDMNCSLDVNPKFPLNLIVTPQSVAGYLFIGTQLHRIRKSLWQASSLSMKTCGSRRNPATTTVTTDVNRVLIFRFCLVNFCSSLRSFFMLKVFSREFAQYSGSSEAAAASSSSFTEVTFEHDLDYMRRVHENYLDLIQTKMLRHPLIENVLIKKMTTMSDMLRKYWMSGMPQSTMLYMEDILKKCWQVVNDFDSIKYSPDFNELSWHFGQPPSYLTN